MDSQMKAAKLEAIATHIHNIEEDRYKTKLSLLSENALTKPFPEMIQHLENEIAIYTKQIAGLEEQYKAVEAE